MIVLVEYGAKEVDASPAVFALLQTRYSKQIEVAHTGREGVYRVTARDYVGRVSLPGGGLLVIRPKVGVANLFYMLCAEAGIADFQPPPTGLQKEADIFHFVLMALLHAVEKLRAGGCIATTSGGKRRCLMCAGASFCGSKRGHGWLDHVQTCAYADLSTDTPENRVLAATLRLMPALLVGQEAPTAARRARGLLGRFAGITPVRRGEAISLLPRVNIHRLNAAYRPALGFVRAGFAGADTE